MKSTSSVSTSVVKTSQRIELKILVSSIVISVNRKKTTNLAQDTVNRSRTSLQQPALTDKMSIVDTQILDSAEGQMIDEIISEKTTAALGSPQSTSILQMAMTALRLTSAAPSSDRTNNNELLNRKQITLDEVSYHDTFSDCWIVLYDRVYDVTKFLRQHPGGHDVLLEHAGRDATIAFIGTGHSEAAIASLKLYEIGELPQRECIYRSARKLIATILPD
ncbi:uncharacterized protein LOC129778676 [Toxorhynchites rutilus septentrionalis]|uniref:uncharacterized protein LOC129778676 n=1 Tax=Toxorhynchites rutilus septentrionalis TaxID=329112 RepID=UPI00247A7A68|nr:uncharacterized protein LOC129778676 [Toxorhynchites rutilus septentrionalis]